MNVPLQSELNVGIIGHVDHGKTSLTKMLTGKFTDTHSEELKRGISIRLGYADVLFKKCPDCKDFDAYCTDEKCHNCKKKTDVVRRVSFVDAPGHESLMATMLSGAAILNGAVLVVAANEPCPQPRTVEHLLAVKYSNVSQIIVVQNKIDLVTKEQAKENAEQIKKFLAEFGFIDVPIIPVSANLNINKDVLIYALVNYFKPEMPKTGKQLKMHVVRSFDVNKPGTDIEKMVGGILGGSIVSGKIKIGDKIEMGPGLDGKKLKASVLTLNTEFGSLQEAGLGGLIAIGTSLDPSLAQNDKLKGQIVALDGQLPEPKLDIVVEVHVIDRLVVDDLKRPLTAKEPMIITIGTATIPGFVTGVKEKEHSVSFNMKIPVLVEPDEKVSIIRRSASGWRLYGYGTIKK